MSNTPQQSPPPSAPARWLRRLLYAAAAASLAVELLVHRHSLFDIEETFGFYALFGFLSYVLIVRSAMLLRRLIKRDEGYYD